MAIIGWSLPTQTAVAFATTDSWVDKTEVLVIRMTAARYLALASMTFLIYDIMVTIEDEIDFFWDSRWTLGRLLFHFNRIFTPITQTLRLLSLFQHNPTAQFCRITSGIYVWSTMVAMASVITVLGVRVWLLYVRSKRVLLVLGTVSVLVTLLPVVVIILGFSKAELLQNPAPDIILGCLFTGISDLAWLPYLGSTLFETLLFGLTVYKVYQSEYQLQIVNRLYRDGSYYFVFVLAANIFTIVGSQYKILNAAAMGSGLLSSIMSAMCSRMLLSTKRFEIKRQAHAPECSVLVRVQEPQWWRKHAQHRVVFPALSGADIEHG